MPTYQPLGDAVSPYGGGKPASGGGPAAGFNDGLDGGPLPHVPSGGCPYRQDETGPSPGGPRSGAGGSGHGGAHFAGHAATDRGGSASALVGASPLLLLAAALAAALVAVRGVRVRLGARRRALLGLLLTLLAVPRWRTALLGMARAIDHAARV